MFFTKIISYRSKNSLITCIDALLAGKNRLIVVKESIANTFNVVCSFIAFNHCTYTGPRGTDTNVVFIYLSSLCNIGFSQYAVKCE